MQFSSPPLPCIFLLTTGIQFFFHVPDIILFAHICYALLVSPLSLFSLLRFILDHPLSLQEGVKPTGSRSHGSAKKAVKEASEEEAEEEVSHGA